MQPLPPGGWEENQNQNRNLHLSLCCRLKSFYQAEWDKVHQLYQEEADKCRLLMEQQVRTHGNQQTANAAAGR